MKAQQVAEGRRWAFFCSLMEACFISLITNEKGKQK